MRFISDPIRNPQGRAGKRIAKVGEDNMCTSIIAAAELYYGCANERLETIRFRLRLASVFVLLHHTFDVLWLSSGVRCKPTFFYI